MFLPTTEINNPTWPGRDVAGNIAITLNGVNLSRNEHLHFCLKLTTSFLSVRFDWQLGNEKVRSELRDFQTHSRPQRPRSYWSAPRIAIWRTSGQVQHRKSTIHGLPVTLRMLRVKSDNLIGSGLNLLCLQSHSKPECRWTWPEDAILGADQKERCL